MFKHKPQTIYILKIAIRQEIDQYHNNDHTSNAELQGMAVNSYKWLCRNGKHSLRL